jgi:RNA polymerase sigma-B factor
MPDVIDRPSAATAPPAACGEDSRARTDRRLFARLHAGDPRAREELIERFLPLARSIARRYEHSAEPLDDLLQIASLGLIKAIDRFDPTKGCAFSSYAVPTIGGELKRHFRDRTWNVRPPRELQELTLRVERATSELTQELDRAPTVAELSAATGSSDERILEAMQARRSRGAVSLQATTGPADDPAALQDRLGFDDDGFDRAEERADIAGLLSLLPARSRLVLRLRFDRDLTQAEIGQLLGISQMQVSRIIRAAVEQLRHVSEQRARLLTSAAA